MLPVDQEPVRPEAERQDDGVGPDAGEDVRLGPARGLVLGLVLALLFWVVVIAWLVLR